MLVYLLRHAIAEETAATDSVRDLTAEGLAQARSITEKFKPYAPAMDTVLCSPYNRAQQTASAVMTLFPDIALTLDESIKPGGDVYGVLDAIEEFGGQHLLIVGHNPFLSNLLSVIVDGTMESHRYVDNATLHCVSMDVVAPGCGEIVYTLEP
ncbi:MAG: phosphohistidine phosphatase SixA [SAR86 cluster bacterium]|uniref:Phosphohistidine phosphatase SixA n=1 Tax=SAR86 cluster bacterium TaxID=2030880 RepID=A0A2A4X8V6_9GAMM|nr:MAG: phosphohistidine phosphatase SixA [SAR86 cluster bacterium]